LGCGSRGRALAEQVQGLEFKSKYCQKKMWTSLRSHYSAYCGCQTIGEELSKEFVSDFAAQSIAQ
jgi:hypothetical protein